MMEGEEEMLRVQSSDGEYDGPFSHVAPASASAASSAGSGNHSHYAPWGGCCCLPRECSGSASVVRSGIGEPPL